SGHYVPVFSRSASEERNAGRAVNLKPAVDRRYLRLIVILSILCLGLTAILIAGWLNRRSASLESRAQELPETLNWFWHPFVSTAEGPLITIPNHPLLRAAHDGDSAETLARGHEIPKDSLPEFRDTIHFHELKRFIFVPSLTDFTSVGETLGTVRLCQMFYTVGQKCRVQQSRLVNLEEIKGDNAILLGGNQT